MASFCASCCTDAAPANGTAPACAYAFRGGPGVCCGLIGERPFCCPAEGNEMGPRVCVADTRNGSDVYLCSTGGNGGNGGAPEAFKTIPTGAGIAVIVVVVLLICGCCFFVMRRRRQAQAQAQAQASGVAMQGGYGGNALHGQPAPGGYPPTAGYPYNKPYPGGAYGGQYYDSGGYAHGQQPYQQQQQGPGMMGMVGAGLAGAGAGMLAGHVMGNAFGGDNDNGAMAGGGDAMMAEDGMGGGDWGDAGGDDFLAES